MNHRRECGRRGKHSGRVGARVDVRGEEVARRRLDDQGVPEGDGEVGGGSDQEARLVRASREPGEDDGAE